MFGLTDLNVFFQDGGCSVPVGIYADLKDSEVNWGTWAEPSTVVYASPFKIFLFYKVHLSLNVLSKTKNNQF